MATASLGGNSRLPRGALREALLEHAVDLVAEAGAEAMSLREVQRRAGVSPAAAYRHYRDREALLLAVAHRAAALLADHLRSAVDDDHPSGERSAADPGMSSAAAALARLRRGCLGYIDFARRQPNLFRTVFLTQESPAQLGDPTPESIGIAGRGAYQILQDCLADVTVSGESDEAAAPWTDTGVWCATHGFAVLTLDGPLQHLNAHERSAAANRLLDLMLQGLQPPATPLTS